MYYNFSEFSEMKNEEIISFFPPKLPFFFSFLLKIILTSYTSKYFTMTKGEHTLGNPFKRTMCFSETWPSFTVAHDLQNNQSWKYILIFCTVEVTRIQLSRHADEK